MDIVEFVEKVCEFSLTDFQKEFVRKVYDAAKNDKRLYYVLPRCNQKFSFELLQAIVIIIGNSNYYSWKRKRISERKFAGWK